MPRIARITRIFNYANLAFSAGNVRAIRGKKRPPEKSGGRFYQNCHMKTTAAYEKTFKLYRRIIITGKSYAINKTADLPLIVRFLKDSLVNGVV